MCSGFSVGALTRYNHELKRHSTQPHSYRYGIRPNDAWLQFKLIMREGDCSRLGLPGSIPALMLPSGGMAARHRKGVTAERFSSETSVVRELKVSQILYLK
ncbi:hypothetical protein CSKR_111495 [Clonorchis sinensis]|uniref:Uncharacterized protein n=1 Tax=Clonorchis sinensis TaxID=79923 RepID=A0A419PYW2_CLOSI|nr:hypothetical protein CSKR_111495 [Clonorchis sinensis]